MKRILSLLAAAALLFSPPAYATQQTRAAFQSAQAALLVSGAHVTAPSLAAQLYNLADSAYFPLSDLPSSGTLLYSTGTGIGGYTLGTGFSVAGSTISVAGSGGGATSPGGTSGAVQYNNAGAFGGFSGTGLLKLNGSGVPTIGVSGTDYAPATTGAGILYGNGSGGFSSVTIGTGLTFSGGTLSSAGGGSGSGTVNSGTAGQMAYYASSAAAVSGDPNFTDSGNILSYIGASANPLYVFNGSSATSGDGICWTPGNTGSNVTQINACGTDTQIAIYIGSKNSTQFVEQLLATGVNFVYGGNTKLQITSSTTTSGNNFVESGTGQFNSTLGVSGAQTNSSTLSVAGLSTLTGGVAEKGSVDTSGTSLTHAGSGVRIINKATGSATALAWTPGTPGAGTLIQLSVLDGKGDANTNNITVSLGGGGNIYYGGTSHTTYVINTAGGGVTLVSDGTNAWVEQ